MTPAVYVSLTKIGNSLKDGISKPADWFEVPESSAPKSNEPIRASKKTMNDWQHDVEQKGNVSTDEILAANPNLPEDQKLLIASWTFKGNEA